MTEKLRVAVVQQPPVLLDRDATTKTVVEAIEQVGAEGARLVVFPETFIPGYPAWIWHLRPGDDYHATSAIHHELLANSVDLTGDDLAPVQEAAARAGVVVVCGVHERDGSFSRADPLQHAGDHRRGRLSAQPAPQAHAHQPRADGLGPGRRLGTARRGRPTWAASAG